MANNTLQITHDTASIASTIYSGIDPIVNRLLKTDVLDYYAKMTEEQKRTELLEYKKDFAEKKAELQNTTSIEAYFNAYEKILEFRKFILGAAGTINYTFVIKANQQGSSGSVSMQTITLGQLDFLKLMKDDSGNIIGLQQSGDNLRFSSAFKSKLRALIKDIENQGMSMKIDSNCSFFILTNETLGTKETFTSGKLFKARINSLQRKYKIQQFYQFELDVTKDISSKTGKNVFKYFITRVDGNPESSSVFSAIGKYFADERTAKQQAVQESYGISVDPSYPNAGNLTELYILAKSRLNQGKNTFYPRQNVSGMTLFELYNQIKANTEPFYSGGDYLLNQIKSFLGSNPTLSSYKTIRKTIDNFYNALNTSSMAETKQQLAKLLLQKDASSQLVTKEEIKLSQTIMQSFTAFFNNLTN